MKYIECKCESGAYSPRRAHPTDAGMDLRTPCNVKVPAHGSATIDTGIHFNIPAGKVGILLPKSGLMCEENIVTFGVIDSGYEGSVICKLFNLGNKDYFVMRGDKVTQIIFMDCDTPQVMMVEEFSKHYSDRGNNGIGSTGK